MKELWRGHTTFQSFLNVKSPAKGSRRRQFCRLLQLSNRAKNNVNIPEKYKNVVFEYQSERRSDITRRIVDLQMADSH